MHPGRPFCTILYPARTAFFLLVILLGMLFCLVPAAMAANDGSIIITSSPPARNACLDSSTDAGNCQIFDGTGTLQFFNISGESNHTISVWLGGYQPYIVTVNVPSGQTVPVNAGLLPVTQETTTPVHASPGFLDGIIAMLGRIFGGHATPQNPPMPIPSTTPAVTVTPVPGTNEKIAAAYFYLFDDGYDAAMSVRDQIPWKKINRVYIGFATVSDGKLVNLPVGSSPDETAQREENTRKIRNVISLCRQNNPDAEIFIVSNFGGSDMDNEYLRAAQDPQRFADSVVAYLNEYDIDGYDMDWKSSNIDDYAAQLKALLSACHATFATAGDKQHGRPWILTHTIWPGVESVQTVAGI